MTWSRIFKICGATLIRTYQIAISPLLLPSCRFTPSCSEYALQAIERYGLGRGLVMGVRRLLRCHPLHPGGYDPPEIPAAASSRINRRIVLPRIGPRDGGKRSADYRSA